MSRVMSENNIFLTIINRKFLEHEEIDCDAI